MAVPEIVIALLVGVALGAVLGLLGGGGGILAIPAFVHIMGMSVDEASTTSLVVVAIGATAGLIPHAIAGRVAWRTGLIFGALGVAGSVLGARAAIIADDRLQLAGLSALIFLAAAGMLRDADDSTVPTMRHRIPAADVVATAPVSGEVPGGDPHGTAATPARARSGSSSGRSAVGAAPAPGTDAPVAAPADPDRPASRDPSPAGASGDPGAPPWWSARVIGSATAVGLVTGFFGVGGGFVAVPALMWGARLPVKMATATGLLVIVMNSVVALAARGPAYLAWPDTGVLGGAAIIGALAGALGSRHVSSRTLKRSFGWFLLVIGAHEIWQLAQMY